MVCAMGIVFSDRLARRLLAASSGDEDGNMPGGMTFQSSGTASPSATSPSDSPRENPDDHDRDLGVIEAISIVTRSCPSGVVVGAAERALDAIKAGGAETMREQAYFVLMAIQGWRGDRARQVHRSLSHYLESAKRPASDPGPDPGPDPDA